MSQFHMTPSCSERLVPVLIKGTEEELPPSQGTFRFSTVFENVSLRNKRKRDLVEQIQQLRHVGLKTKIDLNHGTHNY